MKNERGVKRLGNLEKKKKNNEVLLLYPDLVRELGALRYTMHSFITTALTEWHESI